MVVDRFAPSIRHIRRNPSLIEGFNKAGKDDIVTVNFKATESFLEETDDTWQGQGFNSRSEFIRYTLRDAIEFPMFDRDELIALLKAEEDIREGKTMSADAAREQFGTDDE
ncbi:ribbon-helix-helix domain-containing protein [Halomicroarcula sp. GCM10025709]|uniref:ribbon-helix-helix domain-containing protein n=1 Tax=Haloarcula TaxID=2237 RepID=UPI0024C2288C|nr:ribbon-helix-helix domain-containing protein [Halomicroarcula sp. YJ-61-S]